jgi:hypothetical protein
MRLIQDLRQPVRFLPIWDFNYRRFEYFHRELEAVRKTWQPQVYLSFYSLLPQAHEKEPYRIPQALEPVSLFQAVF